MLLLTALEGKYSAWCSVLEVYKYMYNDSYPSMLHVWIRAGGVQLGYGVLHQSNVHASFELLHGDRA